MKSEIESELRRITRNDQGPVAFVGSGVSTNHPGWSEFICKLSRYVENHQGAAALCGKTNSDLDPTTILAIADESVEKLSSADLRRFMEHTFPGNVGTPPIFGALVRAPFALYLTTNYDSNIEDAFHSNHGTNLPIVLPGDPERALTHMAANCPFVFKIHGCARNGGPYVIGSADYQKTIFGSPRVQMVLQTILVGRPIVFIGYGHRDPHISQYMNLQRQILTEGAVPRFTFVRRSDAPYDIARHYRRLYGLSCIPVDDWHEVEDILDQLSFLEMRDRYVFIRERQSHQFRAFTERGQLEAAWGALRYAFASSEIGRAEAPTKLWQCVRQNQTILDYIERKPSLNLTFRIVTGQMLKHRKEFAREARLEFETAEVLARDHSASIMRPLRAIALRYAGIFWLWPPDPSMSDHRRAAKLFGEAGRVIGDDFPEDALDHRKWEAVLLGENDRLKAAMELVRIAREADSLGYLKNGAWCRYSAADQLMRGGIHHSEIDQGSLLLEAIDMFERLEHIKGLCFSHLLRAKLDLTRGINGREVARRIELARAMAVITGMDRMIERCDTLLTSTN